MSRGAPLQSIELAIMVGPNYFPSPKSMSPFSHSHTENSDFTNCSYNLQHLQPSYKRRKILILIKFLPPNYRRLHYDNNRSYAVKSNISDVERQFWSTIMIGPKRSEEVEPKFAHFLYKA